MTTLTATKAIAEQFERYAKQGLADQENPTMNAIVRHEYARNAAHDRLRTINTAESEAYTAVRAVLLQLQAASGASDKDVTHAMECMWETITDMTYDSRLAVEDEIGECDEAIAEAEETDLRRSVPVRL